MKGMQYKIFCLTRVCFNSISRYDIDSIRRTRKKKPLGTQLRQHLKNFKNQ
jgi:hypothetical protein